MIDLEKPDFETLLRGIADVFSSTKKVMVNAPMLKVYFISLNDYSYRQVEWAIGEHIKDPKHGSFFPKPADIIRHLEVKSLTPEEKAELAWGQIEYEIQYVGSWGTLKLDDEQALAALKSFTTWKGLCSMPIEKLTWAKKEFISMYSTYEKTPVEMLPSSLPGRIELVEHKKENNQSLAKIFNKLKNNTKRIEDK